MRLGVLLVRVREMTHMTLTNYDNYSTKYTGILICVIQMTHFFTKIYKISLKMILFDKNNFMNVNLMQRQEIT